MRRHPRFGGRGDRERNGGAELWLRAAVA
jgi:hypothetical protein